MDNNNIDIKTRQAYILRKYKHNVHTMIQKFILCISMCCLEILNPLQHESTKEPIHTTSHHVSIGIGLKRWIFFILTLCTLLLLK